MRALALAALVLLAAARAQAGDCLAAFEAQPRWACTGALSTGAPLATCINFTNAFGDDATSRFFKLTSVGGYTSKCTCQAKGKAGFGRDAGFACLERGSDTLTEGRITRRKVSGQTFNASVGVSGAFSCVPDPACEVQPVVDPDLAPLHGSAVVPVGVQAKQPAAAGGYVDLAYLGCTGYATEAPTFVFDVPAVVPGSRLDFYFNPGGNVLVGGLVVAPSGDLRCSASTVDFDDPEPGLYRVWIPGAAPGAFTQGEVVSTHRVQ